jgi:hypothetical protein
MDLRGVTMKTKHCDICGCTLSLTEFKWCTPCFTKMQTIEGLLSWRRRNMLWLLLMATGGKYPRAI